MVKRDSVTYIVQFILETTFKMRNILCNNGSFCRNRTLQHDLLITRLCNVNDSPSPDSTSPDNALSIDGPYECKPGEKFRRNRRSMR